MEYNVAYSANDNYCRLLAVSMISLLENNKEAEKINIFCLLYDVSDYNKKELSQIAYSYRRNLYLIDVKEICEKKRFWEKSEDSRYVRLLLADLVNANSILYLDCDIIVQESLSKLFQIDLANFYHASVLDTVRIAQRVEADMKDTNMYFNSGVMLINLKQWRKENLISQFRDFKEKHPNRGVYRDQRVLNGTTAERYIVLPPIYNSTPEIFNYTHKELLLLTGNPHFYSKNDIEAARNKPIIVHFAGRSIDRPWFKNSKHPYTQIYREYMKLSKYTNFPLYKDSWVNIVKWQIKKNMPFYFLYWIIKYKERRFHTK